MRGVGRFSYYVTDFDLNCCKVICCHVCEFICSLERSFDLLRRDLRIEVVVAFVTQAFSTDKVLMMCPLNSVVFGVAAKRRDHGAVTLKGKTFLK